MAVVYFLSIGKHTIKNQSIISPIIFLRYVEFVVMTLSSILILIIYFFLFL